MHPGILDVAGPGGTCQALIGTCGYSYLEWVDSGFYPAGTKTADMLPLYARSFSTVELNYTWYQMARAEAVARLVARAPSHFQFSAKLTRSLTHEPDSTWQEQIRQYREGIAPLQGRLLAVLVQLPPDFDRSLANRRYLAGLLDGLADLPLAVEFRNATWAVDSVFSELERRRISLVTVDTPSLPGLFPSLDVVTNPDLVYVRFHGRNLSGWRSGNMQKKFDYDYSGEELQEWAVRLRRMAQGQQRAALFFNNHVRAQAPRNGQRLLELLAQTELV